MEEVDLTSQYLTQPVTVDLNPQYMTQPVTELTSPQHKSYLSLVGNDQTATPYAYQSLQQENRISYAYQAPASIVRFGQGTGLKPRPIGQGAGLRPRSNLGEVEKR